MYSCLQKKRRPDGTIVYFSMMYRVFWQHWFCGVSVLFASALYRDDCLEFAVCTSQPLIQGTKLTNSASPRLKPNATAITLSMILIYLTFVQYYDALITTCVL